MQRLRRSESIRTAAIVAGLVVLATVALVLWRPWPSAVDVIWAEDGPVFLYQSLHIRFEDIVLWPYNGYAHVVPRLLTKAVTLLPVTWWALGLATASALVRAGLGAVVWYSLAAHVPSRFARALIAAALVTLPLGNYETLDSVANLHWFLTAAALPALLWVPATWRGRVIQWLVVAGAVLSDPVTSLLAPLVLARLVLVRRWPDQVVSVVFVAASAVQAVIVVGTSRATASGMGLKDIAPTYLVRVVLAAFGGKGGTEWAFGRAGWLAVAAAVLVSAVVLALGFREPGPHRVLIVSSLLASAGLFAVAMRFGILTGNLTPTRPLNLFLSPRYSVTAAVLLLTALVAAGAAALRAGRGRARLLMGAGAAGLIAIYAVGVVLSVGPLEPAPESAPWRVGVRQACSTQAEVVGSIKIAPSGWTVEVPCTLIRADR